jgi:biofilm PGA synthesis N-glycosyltransferase PgaC
MTTDILVARTVGDVHTVTTAPEPPPLRSRFAQAGRLAVQSIIALPNTPALPQQRQAPPQESKRHATIACIIPCYNEQDTIADVLTSLLAQTRLPDVIHVIVNNTDDDTLEIARKFAGPHSRTVKGRRHDTVIHIHDMGVNADKKVGALNYGYRLCRGYDYILGVDGDTTLDRKAVEWLELEMVDDPRIGGLSAIYSIDKSKIHGVMGKFLVAGQRAQFAGFNMDNLARGRNMAVLGGQCSLFSVMALEAVMRRHHSVPRGCATRRWRTRSCPCRSRTAASARRSAPGRGRTSAR